MFRFRMLIALWLIMIFLPVTLTSPTETNAQRMARGLPPLPPRKFGSIPGRSPLSTRVMEARSKTSPSSVPSQIRRSRIDEEVLTPPTAEHKGRLQVKAKDGSVLGFVRNGAGYGTIGGINFRDEGSDLHVEFTTRSGRPFSIIATNPAFHTPFYVGAAGSSNLFLHDSASLAFTNVRKTTSYSVPLASNKGYEESAIWSLDHDTKELTAQHTNMDGTKSPTILAYDAMENELFFVGDLDAYNYEKDLAASSVKLYFVDS